MYLLHTESSVTLFLLCRKAAGSCGGEPASPENTQKAMPMDWREKYRDRGFIICKNALPHDLIDAHVADVAALSRQFGVVDVSTLAALPIKTDDELMVAMLELHKRSGTARRLIFNRIAGAILRQLFDAEPALAFARSALWEPGDVPAHVDAAFQSPDPPYAVCRTWCALEDIHPESARFFLVPGTHRSLLPRLCDEVLGERPDLLALSLELAEEPDARRRLFGRAWPLVNAKVAHRIDGNAKISFNLEKGDVIFFNPAVAHGVLACADPRLTRKMMICEWTTTDSTSMERPPPPIREFSRAH
jgi:hypothetical protein